MCLPNDFEVKCAVFLSLSSLSLYFFRIISFQLIVTSSFVVSFKFRDPTFADALLCSAKHLVKSNSA